VPIGKTRTPSIDRIASFLIGHLPVMISQHLNEQVVFWLLQKILRLP
jgi:hypothetical protein